MMSKTQPSAVHTGSSNGVNVRLQQKPKNANFQQANTTNITAITNATKRYTDIATSLKIKRKGEAKDGNRSLRAAIER